MALLISGVAVGGGAVARDPHSQSEVQSWQLGSLRVLRLVGELDVLTVPGVRVKLDEVLLTFDELSLIVDLTPVTFIASVGVGVLVEIRRQVSERGGRLIVVLPPGGRPRRLFELTRMIDYFEVRETLEDAVHAFQGDDPAVAPGETVARRRRHP
jgi:anti-anti-sigma factor